MANRRIELTLLVLLFAIVLTQCMNVEATPRPTLTPISVNETSELPTETSMPGINPEQAQQMLLQMLRTNGGCKFPCLLGIQPGVDTKTTLLNKLGPILSIATNSGENAYTSTEITTTPTNFSHSQEWGEKVYAGFEINRDDITLHVDLDFYLQKDVDSLEHIRITAKAFRVAENDFDYAFDSQEFEEILHTLSLQGILTEYGMPSQLSINAINPIGEPYGPGSFGIWIVYRDYGTIALFNGFADVDEDKISFCPANSFVSIWLFNPTDLSGIQTWIEQYTGQLKDDHPSLYLPLDVAIGMDNEDFVDTFSHSSETCVETPISLWAE